MLTMNHGVYGVYNYLLQNALMVVTLVKVMIKQNVHHGNFSNGLGLDKKIFLQKVGMLKEPKQKVLTHVEVSMYLVEQTDLVKALLFQEDMSCQDITELRLS